MMIDPLTTYLSEIEGFGSMPWPERTRLLASARTGNSADREAVIRACLLETAGIAISCREPSWMADLEKIQEANIVLLRCIDDPEIEDLHAALRDRIPARLKSIPGHTRDWPPDDPRQ